MTTLEMAIAFSFLTLMSAALALSSYVIVDQATRGNWPSSTTITVLTGFFGLMILFFLWVTDYGPPV